MIRENQWGGVDIRRGGVPVLRSNLICFGYSDGVVVGDEGKGLIEGNTIYGEEHTPWGGAGVHPSLGAGSLGSSSSSWVLRKSPWFPGFKASPEDSMGLRPQPHSPPRGRSSRKAPRNPD